jgi:hypothetical protein
MYRCMEGKETETARPQKKPDSLSKCYKVEALRARVKRNKGIPAQYRSTEVISVVAASMLRNRTGFSGGGTPLPYRF